MRKNSKSLRKSSPSKSLKKKDCLKRCERKEITPLNIQNSLSRKYSNTQKLHYICCINKTVKQQHSAQKTQSTQTQECLEKYYKALERKHILPRIKQVYKLHAQIPRIFQPSIKQILNKCYYRKRILEYLKIAKVLGIKVDCGKFSTFLVSVNDITNKKNQKANKYERIITNISTIDFSRQGETNSADEIRL